MRGMQTLESGRVARLSAALGAALVLAVTATGAVAAQEDAEPAVEPVRTITVSATGHTEVEPDEAVLRVSVSARAPTAEAATRRGAQGMTRVIEALEAAGVAPEDIRTTSIDLNEQRRRDRETEEVTVSWQVSNQVRATVGDLDTLGAVIDAAVEAGATGIGSLRFRSTDDTAAESQARREAVLAAEATASELADAAGVELVGLLSLVEGDAGDSVSSPVPWRAYAGDTAGAPVTPIEPGMIDVTVTVHVVYEVG